MADKPKLVSIGFWVSIITRYNLIFIAILYIISVVVTVLWDSATLSFHSMTLSLFLNIFKDMSSSDEACGLDENSGTQKIWLFDHVNGFHYNALKKSDNFVIDMDTFSHKLQKSLSRKGSQRGCSGGGANANDRDATLVATSPPIGPSAPERLAVAAIGSKSITKVHNQITITTCNSITTADSKSGFRGNSFKRSSRSCALDPKRVLLFFATMSIIGTVLLIYFTLSLKYRADENTLDYKS